MSECGCRIERVHYSAPDGGLRYMQVIKQCPLHEAAERMLAALEPVADQWETTLDEFAREGGTSVPHEWADRLLPLDPMNPDGLNWNDLRAAYNAIRAAKGEQDERQDCCTPKNVAEVFGPEEVECCR